MNIQIENKFLKLTCDVKGGQWTSLIDKETQTEHLFQGNEDSWPRQAPILFPIVGALKENQMIHYGQLYSMNQHGFFRDINLRVVSRSKSQVTFELVDNEETRQSYPFSFRVLMTYRLKKNRVITDFVVENTDEGPLYFGLGGHPGFIIDAKETNILKAKSKGRFLLEGSFISGYQETTQSKYDLHDVDLEATLILDDIKKAVLKTPSKKITLKMKPSKYMGFWAPKNRVTSEMEDVICLEPWWGIADCVESNQLLKDKKGMIKLEPNESKQFEFSIKLDVFDQLPQAIGPYSLSSESEELVITSGQLPVNPKTGNIEVFDITSQTEASLKNVRAVLRTHKLTLDDVIKTTVFLKNMDDFNSMNEVYQSFFKEPYPARSAVEVARLPKDAMVEIEVIARKSSRKK